MIKVTDHDLHVVVLLHYHSDPTMTADSVAESIYLINDWQSLHSVIRPKTLVPGKHRREILKRCSTKRDIANECASYYVHCHPQPSWTHLASHLYSKGEFAAVERLKPFLPLRGNYHNNIIPVGNFGEVFNLAIW
jgi:hypothetical protein